MAPIKRIPRRADAFMVPRALPDAGRYEVDGTWGSIQPMELAPGVRTVGELEVIEQIETGLPLVDSRLPHFHEQATIPSARGIPHTDTVARIDELDASLVTVFFCNGPQCSATPDAVGSLLAAGYPAEAILYYRGGMHDWMTLSLPVAPGGAA
jgi:rhodanese-related sulfurtransferase